MEGTPREIRCPKCGGPIDEKANTCCVCGEPVERQTPSSQAAEAKVASVMERVFQISELFRPGELFEPGKLSNYTGTPDLRAMVESGELSRLKAMRQAKEGPQTADSFGIEDATSLAAKRSTEAPAAATNCPQCGNVLDRGVGRCSICGYTLQQSAYAGPRARGGSALLRLTVVLPFVIILLLMVLILVSHR